MENQNENQNQEQNQESLLADSYLEAREFEKETLRMGVKKARNALFAVAALLFVGEMFSYYQLQKSGLYEIGPMFWVYITLEIGVFIGLAFWTKKKPYTAVLAGIICYTAIILLSAIDNPANIIKGIFVKVLIYGYLFKSLSDAKALQAMEKEDL